MTINTNTAIIRISSTGAFLKLGGLNITFGGEGALERAYKALEAFLTNASISQSVAWLRNQQIKAFTRVLGGASAENYGNAINNLLVDSRTVAKLTGHDFETAMRAAL